MKSKPLFFIYLCVIVYFCSCEPPQKTYSQNNIESVPFEESYSEPWNNPVLIQGSSFGHYFQQLYKQGQFEKMVQMTSQKSIEKYGRDSVLKYYKNIDFGYKMKLKSQTINNNITTLNYESIIMGTTKITRLDVVVENDTCRLLLDNTLFHLGITWSIAASENSNLIK